MNLNTSTKMPAVVPPIAIKPDALAPLTAATQPAGAGLISPMMPGLILFGRDERGRPHASHFAAAQAESAARAAALMGLHTLVVIEAHWTLAAGLPQGRLFESGKAFVPFCSARVFADLLAAAGPARRAARPGCKQGC